MKYKMNKTIHYEGKWRNEKPWLYAYQTQQFMIIEVSNSIFLKGTGMRAKMQLPTQIRFPIGRERVTCHGSKLTNSLGRTKFINSIARPISLTPQGNNNLNFRLARDQVVYPETMANLSASQSMSKKAIEVGQGFSLETASIIQESKAP